MKGRINLPLDIYTAEIISGMMKIDSLRHVRTEWGWTHPDQTTLKTFINLGEDYERRLRADAFSRGDVLICSIAGTDWNEHMRGIWYHFQWN